MTRSSPGYVRVVGTDVSITRLGFGCARIFGGHETRASAQLIETALDAGIRHFDTAPSYANGQSEEVLGSILAGVPNITIATKIGIPRGEGQPRHFAVLYRLTVRPMLARVPKVKSFLLSLRAYSSSREDNDATRREISKDEILQGLEESLRRLRRSRADLFLVHEPDNLELNHETQQVFLDLQRQGLIGAFGLAWDRVVATPPAFGHVVQSRYNAEVADTFSSDETRIFHGVLRYAKKAGTSEGDRQSPGDRIRHLLDRHPYASVVFSASHSSQIRKIVERCR